MRYLPVLALLGIVLALCARPAGAEVTYGYVHGTVVYPDGGSTGVLTVVVKTDGESLFFTTDEGGAFTGSVPVGPATLTAGQATVTTTIVAGQVNTVTIAATRTGWVLAITGSDHTPAAAVYRVTAAYKVAEQPASGTQQPSMPTLGATPATPPVLTATSIGPGLFLFPPVPDNVSDFSVIYCVQMGRSNSYQRQQWSFQTPAKFRMLTAIAHLGAEVTTTVVNAESHPLANTRVTGTLTIPQMWTSADPYWSEKPFFLITGELRLSNLQTDEQGLLALGRLPTGSYTLSLTTEDAIGAPATFAVRDDATQTLPPYAVRQQRTVTQTVFTLEGKPAPGVMVHATYCWKQQVYLLQQQADAQGIVVWQHLPPVRTITWGTGISASVIPIMGSVMDTPLPSPEQTQQNHIPVSATTSFDSGISLTFSIANPSQDTEQYDGFELRSSGWQALNFGPSQHSAVGSPLLTVRFIQPGTPCDFVIVTRSILPRYAVVTSYIPYDDDAENAYMQRAMEYPPLTLQDGMEIHGRFITRDGQTLRGVNTLSIEQVQAASRQDAQGSAEQSLLAQLTDQLLRSASTLRSAVPLHFTADGTFTMAVLVAGKYRLLVDLYDETTPTPAALLLDVHPGKNDITVKLPDPLITLPAGTTLNWLTRPSPARLQQLVVSAQMPRMPVFGAKENLLAYWYREGSDQLVVWDHVGAMERTRHLALRTVDLTLLDNVDTHRSAFDSYKILPLFPGTLANNTRYQQSIDMSDGSSTSVGVPGGEMALLNLPTSAYSQRLDVWATNYLLVDSRENQHALDFSNTDTAQVTVHLDNGQASLYLDGGLFTDALRINFPGAGYTDMQKSGASAAAATFDHPQQIERTLSPMTGEQDFSIPWQAKTMTIQWLGVGVMRDVPLPPHQDRYHKQPQQLQPTPLPAWSPGAVITATVSGADGHPVADADISAVIGGERNTAAYSKQLKTDATGKFTLKGLFPGPVQLWDLRGNAGWAINVPADGLPTLALRTTATPLQTNMRGLDDKSLLWWFPDGGAPQILAHQMHDWWNIRDYALVPGAGWLWRTDNKEGSSSYQRYIFNAGFNEIPTAVRVGPTLGIRFPLDLPAGMPGQVTLIGLDARAGITASYPQFTWSPSSVLGIVTGQIDAVPPGHYQIRVDTPRGQVSKEVTVTDDGCAVVLAYPPAPPTDPVK
jgi:hypothetical protein